MSSAIVAGVGMTRFRKPSEKFQYDELAIEAVRVALQDSGLRDYRLIQQIYAGYVYGDSCSGQRALYPVGLSGVPIVNVNNNCSTGSSALFLARQAIASGEVDCALALGFEQMAPGPLGNIWSDRPSPFDPFLDAMEAMQGRSDAPIAAQLFGGAGREYSDRYGCSPTMFAQVAVKARAHAKHNPNAVFRNPLSVEEVLASPVVFDLLTRLQCCPPTCGAAAALICSPQFARRHGIDGGISVVAQSMTTDDQATFEPPSMMSVVGYGMAAKAAEKVYVAAGVGPEDMDVVELHDCFTANEVISYEALALTPVGTAERFMADGENTYGGRCVTNPSGGLLSKGHPLGATGLAQCAELVTQLRGKAGARQVEGARFALQHNVGVGGACVVTMYSRV